MQTLLSIGLPFSCELALWWYVSHILVVIAELFCSRMCLLSFSLLSQLLKSTALVVVGISVVGVEADGLLISREGLLVPLEVTEGFALSYPLLFAFLKRWNSLLVSGFLGGHFLRRGG